MKRVMFVLLLAIAVAPSAWAQSWPNEPSGSTVLTDWAFSSATGGGWTGTGSITSDSNAPLSPSNVLRYSFNPSNGHGGGELGYALPSSTREIYFAFWWKPSNPYQGYSNHKNKIAFLFSTGMGLWYLSLTGPQYGPYQLTFELEFPVSNSHLGSGYGDSIGTWVLFGNRSTPTVALGQWHRIEIRASGSTTQSSKDGTLMCWLDGQLTHSVSQLNTTTPYWSVAYLTPSWDGSEQRSNPDEQRFDHVRISAGGSGSAPKGDTTPPASPTGLRAN